VCRGLDGPGARPPDPSRAHPMSRSVPSAAVLGVIAALIASTIWGGGPLFFNQLSHVPPVELLAHRMVWGAVFVGAFCWATGRGPRLRAAFADPRQRWPLLASALLIALNWFVFLWSVQAGRVTEAGVGYYLMPLVSVLLGTALLGERLSHRQWVAVGAAASAVAVLSVGIGAAPWLPVTLAVSFSLYGLIRKRIATGAIVGFQAETLMLVPLALLWLGLVHSGAVLEEVDRPGGLFGADPRTSLLLVLAGPYTGLPLILFAEAARRLAYSTTGMIQYLNPTLQVGCAGLILGELFTPWHVVALGLIWAGLALYTLELLRLERAARKASIAPAGVSARER